MLPEENRLRKKKDIELVYKKGQRFSCPLFLLITLSRKNENLPSRYAIVISKRVSSLAVQRNRGRRVVRELIRFSLHRLKNGYDSIILVNQKFFGQSMDEIKVQFDEIFYRAGLIKK